jgi:hypothetical protein
MEILGQQQYKDSLLTHNAVIFFCVLMITGFQLDDRFTEETMACNRKQNGHWFLKRRDINCLRYIVRFGMHDKMGRIFLYQNFSLSLGLSKAASKLL